MPFVRETAVIGGKEITIETGKWAKQAAGAVVVRLGDTMVLVTAGGSKSPREGMDFLPLTWERFDLVMRQRDYFLPGPQALFNFMRASVLPDRAAELSGYDVNEAGAVRLVN